MQKRQYLKKSILLCEENDQGKFLRTFTIVGKNGEGASSICYEAYHKNSGNGILKEFYPGYIRGLERNEAGQIICGENTDKEFEKAKQDYIEPYVMMRDLRRKAESQELSHFIPDFEIYDGCDKDCNPIGSVYIWMPRPKLITFDTICDSIHKHPSVKPELNLVTVLEAVKYLTKCICGLHQNDMLHRDIKPSNFGFAKSGDESEILPQTLSMFDINSVCSVYLAPENGIGTLGYLEPEACLESATNQTDIYAIGATLFHAAVVSKETAEKGYLYQDEYYDRLKELVDSSKLIQASEANSHPRLRSQLTVILQKCLCGRQKRYANCEELLEDIEKALDYALPSELARKNRSGEKWVLADVERASDKHREKNTALALQYHLYEHPLYQCAEDMDINVLIIGFGNYGQKFLDRCLQIGRIGQSALNVTIVSEDVTDMELYLQERPGLPEFFNGNLVWTDDAKEKLALEREALRAFFGKEKQEEDSYGNIVFQVTELARDNQEENENILKNDVMLEHCDTNYVFIALGEDRQNFAAAKACQSVIDDLGMNCRISYVQEEDDASAADAENMIAVYVNRDIHKSALYPEIERMAFNTHLIWKESLNVDFAKVRAEYRNPYNHDSSVGHVVAMKYWLYGLGIDMDDKSMDNRRYDKAAELFSQKVLSAGAESLKLKKELIWLEHSRWVTEKVCQGWRKLENLDECMDGSTKNAKKKQHICILKSSMDKTSLEDICKNDSRFWDKATNAALKKLDDLDGMSVRLHKKFMVKAKAVKKDNLLNKGNMEIIRKEVDRERNPKVTIAFQEWYGCLKELWNGDREKVRLYGRLKNKFLHQAELLPDNCRKNIKRQAEAFEKQFYPILGSMEYTDYKKKDVDYIDNIPFILSYTDNVYLTIPFSIGNNTDVFQNVAAATIMNPARILYLCSLEDKADEETLMETIPRIVSYMDKRQMRSKVEFMIGGIDYLSPDRETELGKSIQELSSKRILQTKFIRMEGEALETAFRACLMQRRKEGRLIVVEKKREEIRYRLDQESFSRELYKDFPNFEFDTAQMKFLKINSCALASYIKTKDTYITTGDMAALRCAWGESHNPEFSKDYKKLWELYSRDTSTWKSLCTALRKWHEDHDEIISFSRNGAKSNDKAQKYTYMIPFACRDTVSAIMEALIQNEIVETEGDSRSRIEEFASDSCKVTIYDKYECREKYNRLFSNPYALMVPDAVQVVETYKKSEVCVKFDSPVVTEVLMNEADKKSLLNEFCEMGYLIDLKDNGTGKMSFVYATRAIKELLTTEGRILEVYVYHKVKESGKFDDVESSYEIIRDKTGKADAENEFDCILTKGFRTLLVECKAREKIEADIYYKADSLQERYGINVTKILITDTRNSYQSNEKQRERGNRMDNPVVTVWELDDIKNIDRTLEKILDGTYKSE